MFIPPQRSTFDETLVTQILGRSATTTYEGLWSRRRLAVRRGLSLCGVPRRDPSARSPAACRRASPGASGPPRCRSGALGYIGGGKGRRDVSSPGLSGRRPSPMPETGSSVRRSDQRGARRFSPPPGNRVRGVNPLAVQARLVCQGDGPDDDHHSREGRAHHQDDDGRPIHVGGFGRRSRRL